MGNKETLTMLNGNKKVVVKDLPEIYYLTAYINPIALKHIAENTGLHFEKTEHAYTATPTSSNQIVRLFLTYNFKTKYYNNWQFNNTLVIKSDHNVGFHVDLVCNECLKANNIKADLPEGQYLAC